MKQLSSEQSSSILVMHTRHYQMISTLFGMKWMDTHQKEAIFKELYSLDESESDGEVCPLTVFRKSVKTSNNSEHRRHSTPLQLVGHIISTPAHSTVSSSPKNIDVTAKTSTKATKAKPGNSAVSTAISKSMPPNKSTPVANHSKYAPKAGKKRKREQPVELVPVSQRVFADCTFFFFPNNDVSEPRRMRIRKAIERGALWVREWREDITHIIVDRDRGLCYNDVISFLKIPSLPSNTVLVDEGYTADCIVFNSLVNPDQPQYRVEGHLLAQEMTEPAPTSSSDVSLQLKPDRSAYARQPQTPSRTDGSEQESLRAFLREAEARALEKERQIAERTKGKGKTRDALDTAIEELRSVKDLPLDPSDIESPSEDLEAEGSSAEHSEDEKRKAKSKKSSSNVPWQEKFNCMQKHDGLNKDDNPNHSTILILQQMVDHYERTRDHWRVTAYRKGIAALRKQKNKIMTKEDAFAIPFIGKRLAEKIEEIVWTNRLQRLENANLEPKDQVLQMFLKIYGVGFAQASAWINQGFRTMDDLTQKASLTKNQKIGITHYEDFLARIPRVEVGKHGKVVREAIRKVDDTIQVTIGGSYRRGASDSGDIDFIITKPDSPIENLRTIMFDTVIPRMFVFNYLRAGLATSAKEDGSKWHGAACLPGSSTWRRIDFLLVPWDEMGAALIYFTGNDIFNRSIRLLASKKGMRLNQHGLWRDVIRGSNRERVTQGSLVEGKSEKRIFEILEVPYRPPEHRIC